MSTPIRIALTPSDREGALRQAGDQPLSEWLRGLIEIAADGRRVPPPTEHRSHNVHLRLSPELRERVQRAADKAGVSVVAWIRSVLRAAI